MKIEFRVDGNLMSFETGDVSVKFAGSDITITEEGQSHVDEIYIQPTQGMDELVLLPMGRDKMIVRTK